MKKRFNSYTGDVERTECEQCGSVALFDRDSCPCEVSEDNKKQVEASKEKFAYDCYLIAQKHLGNKSLPEDVQELVYMVYSNYEHTYGPNANDNRM